MEKLYIIKIGGNIIDDESRLPAFLKEFSNIAEKKILVHGGGKLATELGKKLGIPQQMTEGRRITDAETLKVVTMVYAGYINKNIVARLQSLDCNAIGLTGADANGIIAHKRRNIKNEGLVEENQKPVDFGFVGDIDSVNENAFKKFLDDKFVPVLSPITHDGKGQLLNTNADTIASELAKAFSDSFDVELIFTFEKSGVLADVNDESSLIKKLERKNYEEMKSVSGTASSPRIFSGMIPKLDNAFAALDSGVKKVTIGKAENLSQLLTGKAGTTIVND